jgi:hypothetical protein
VGFLRARLSYANVVSTLALFLALSGGAVYAAGKIGTDDITANAIKSKQIAPGAVQRSDMATPVGFVAKAQGGSAAFTAGETAYPLSGKTRWTQGASEVDQFTVQVNGSVASNPTPPGGFPGFCLANVFVKVNGITVTSAFLGPGTPSTTGTGVLMDGGSKVKRTMTASLQASADCAPGSKVDSVRIRGIGTG